jgi:carbamoyltransferase
VNILGIHDGHNAAACLLVDGAITMAVQEERIRRVKNFAGFPAMAIRCILEDSGMRLEDVEAFALVGLEMPDQRSREQRLELYRTIGRNGDAHRRGCHRVSRNGNGARAARVRNALEFGIPEDRIHLVEHHAAHAAAAYHGHGVYDRDLLVLTNDGEGDGLCATVSIGRGGELARIASVARSDSIGNLYAVVTFLLGMVPLEHEYKLMGMAPYADEDRVEVVCRKLRSLFGFEDPNPYRWTRSTTCPDPFFSYATLRSLFEGDRFDWICGGLQRFTEEMVLGWIGRCVDATGIHHLALSGGVFMNVKLNQRIMQMLAVENLFVFPSSGDESNSIGAAYAVAAQTGGHERLRPIGHLYLGRSYDNNAVRRAIDEYRFGRTVDVRVIDDIEQETAELLAGGAVVARFQGREEFGARALGNRSILADPSNPDVVKTINTMVKCRDFWMPFAPSMTDRQAAGCLVNPKRIAAPYMTITFDTTDCRSDFRAGTHPYDGTARPQVVSRDWNPRYYRLIEEFERISGRRGGVLNTSFNLHGQPLVSSPRDALEVFDCSGLEFLAMEDHLISKRP